MIVFILQHTFRQKVDEIMKVLTSHVSLGVSLNHQNTGSSTVSAYSRPNSLPWLIVTTYLDLTFPTYSSSGRCALESSCSLSAWLSSRDLLRVLKVLHKV